MISPIQSLCNCEYVNAITVTQYNNMQYQRA